MHHWAGYTMSISTRYSGKFTQRPQDKNQRNRSSAFMVESDVLDSIKYFSRDSAFRSNPGVLTCLMWLPIVIVTVY